MKMEQTMITRTDRAIGGTGRKRPAMSESPSDPDMTAFGGLTAH